MADTRMRGTLVKKGHSKGGSVLGAGTATHRAQVHERQGSRLRIDVSRSVAFPGAQKPHWQGRTIAPLPGRSVGGYSMEPWARRAP